MTNELPVLNTELLERAMEYAIAHEQRGGDGVKWDQAFYYVNNACGTTMCLAGITCELTDARWADSYYEGFVQHEPGDVCMHPHQLPGLVSVRSRAVRLLGLTCDEANYLFDGRYHGAGELRLRVKLVVNGEFRDGLFSQAEQLQ